MVSLRPFHATFFSFLLFFLALSCCCIIAIATSTRHMHSRRQRQAGRHCSASKNRVQCINSEHSCVCVYTLLFIIIVLNYIFIWYTLLYNLLLLLSHLWYYCCTLVDVLVLFNVFPWLDEDFVVQFYVDF